LYDLYYKRISIKRLIQLALPSGIFFLLLSVVIDSIFWNRPLWPEGEVLWFNTVLNRSSDYGSSPFLWYFYSAIPRAMASSVFLLPLGLYFDDRARKLFFPAVIFVLLYSILPHKELRFIIYVFPFLNVAAAVACHRIWENRNKSGIYHLLSLGVVGHLIVNAAFTIFLLTISSSNYPGGAAISHFHRIAANETYVNVHIDNLAAQTGVSRFTEINPYWRYDKTENLKPGSPIMFSYNYLIAEGKSKFSPNMKPYVLTHDIVEVIESFHQVSFNYLALPPVKIKTKPALFILKRRKDYRHFMNNVEYFEEDESEEKEEVTEEKIQVDTSKDKSEECIENKYEEKVTEKSEKETDTSEAISKVSENISEKTNKSKKKSKEKVTKKSSENLNSDKSREADSNVINVATKKVKKASKDNRKDNSASIRSESKKETKKKIVLTDDLSDISGVKLNVPDVKKYQMFESLEGLTESVEEIDERYENYDTLSDEDTQSTETDVNEIDTKSKKISSQKNDVKGEN